MSDNTHYNWSVHPPLPEIPWHTVDVVTQRVMKYSSKRWLPGSLQKTMGIGFSVGCAKWRGRRSKAKHYALQSDYCGGISHCATDQLSSATANWDLCYILFSMMKNMILVKTVCHSHEWLYAGRSWIPCQIWLECSTDVKIVLCNIFEYILAYWPQKIQFCEMHDLILKLRSGMM